MLSPTGGLFGIRFAFFKSRGFRTFGNAPFMKISKV